MVEQIHTLYLAYGFIFMTSPNLPRIQANRSTAHAEGANRVERSTRHIHKICEAYSSADQERTGQQSQTRVILFNVSLSRLLCVE